MRRRGMGLLVAVALPGLLIAAALTGCGDDDTSTSEQDGREESGDAGTTAGETTTTTPSPATGSCEEGSVRDAIDGSGGVASDLSYEISYLSCAEGYGWAVISSDGGESATVLLRVSGSEPEVLNLGTSVCATDSGIPPAIAARIAPPGDDPVGDCP